MPKYKMYVSSRAISVLQGQPIGTTISITSADIINVYNSLLASVKTAKTSNALLKISNEQQIQEKSLITNVESCSLPVLSGLRDHISGLNSDEFKDITRKQLQNPDVMKAAMCTTDSLFYTSPYDIGSIHLNNRIRMYIHNLRQIGKETSEGHALVADFQNAKDMFIIKVARDPADDSLVHELVVGLYGTNKLRQYIPNFAYVYGGFKCSPPLIDPNTKNVVTWCLHNTNSVNYVIYENIAPSMPVSEYLKMCNGQDFLNVFMQILYSLRLGLRLIDYTHYDLHYENVLIRDPRMGGTFQIKYETERGVEYIRTQIISTLIDYGHSHIKIGENHYGKNGLVPFSIYSYRSWIMHDLYKFLMFCILGAYKNDNQSVLNDAIKIFRFFNSVEDPLEAVNTQAAILYSFPLTKETVTLTIDDLASHIRMVCNCDFINSTKTSDPVLDCENMCYSSQETIDKIGMNLNAPVPIPKTVPEFYDITVRLQNSNRSNDRDRIKADFNYNIAMGEHIKYMRELVDTIWSTREDIKMIDVSLLPKEELLTYDIMNKTRAMYVNVASIIDNTVILKFYDEVGISVAQIYNDGKGMEEIKSIMKYFNDNVRPSIEETKVVLGKTNKYLDTVKEYQEEAIQKDSRLQWYWNGRYLFDVVFGLRTLPTTKIDVEEEIETVKVTKTTKKK